MREWSYSAAPGDEPRREDAFVFSRACPDSDSATEAGAPAYYGRAARTGQLRGIKGIGSSPEPNGFIRAYQRFA